MTNILSSISGYFSRSLILGTFLPVTIFVVLSLLFLVPILPAGITLSVLLEGLDTGKIVGITFVIIVLSGLLFNMNIPILRLYEGYPWSNSGIGAWLRGRHVRRFIEDQQILESLRAVLRKMEAVDRNFGANAQLVQEVLENTKSLSSTLNQIDLSNRKWLQFWHGTQDVGQSNLLREHWRALSQNLRSGFSDYRIQVKRRYPDRAEHILPTRLGNVVRAFEFYSDREYGIDSVEIWPRLVAVVPAPYASSIDETKSTFDFMLNCSFLSAVLATVVFFVGAIYPSLVLSTGAFYWLIKVALLICLSYFFYQLSINRAEAWGRLVKAAIDLYRWELLKQLGYKQQFLTRDEERKHWREVSRQAIYGDRYDKTLIAYAPPSRTFPSVQPAETQLTRGVKRDETTGVTTIYLRVKNTSLKSSISGITVTDLLPDEFDFQWDSAKIDGIQVNVSGTNPYEFFLGSLEKGAEAVLTYQAVPKKSNRFSVSLN